MRKIIEFIIAFLFGKKDEIVRKEYVEYIVKDYDIKLYQEINAYRQSLGLSFLEYGCEDCFNIVGEHVYWLDDRVSSKEDVKIFAHWNNYDRFEQIKLRTSDKVRCGEVVAYGFAQPKSVVYGWDSSSRHKEILNGDFNYVAIASEGKCVVAIFYKL